MAQNGTKWHIYGTRTQIKQPHIKEEEKCMAALAC